MLRPLLVCLLLCTSLSKPTKKKDRVIHRDTPPRPDGHDDTDHKSDHQAFLGEEEAKRFEQLPLEESMRRLSIMADRMDTDRDGLISQEELKTWIRWVQVNHTLEQVEAQWKNHDQNRDGLVSWDEYQDVRRHENPEAEFNFTRVMEREQRRFKYADTNGDGSADHLEFGAFLHPEEHQHMRDVLVLETMEEMDTDGDGFIHMNEFIDDLHSPDSETEVPEWVEPERQHFSESLDQNKDGRLDKQEVQDWILPSDSEFVEAEAKHLVDKSDTNQDGKLSRSEVLQNHEMFVGSQATNFGEALLQHDEF